MGSKSNTNSFGISALSIVAITAFANPVLIDRSMAVPAGAHHSFLGGPWEIVVKMSLDDDGRRVPVDVTDETKPQKLDAILPIKGTSIEIRLEHYVPDLKWETNATEDPDGSIAAKLLIEGANLKQDIWLSSGDPARQSVSSRIGTIIIRRIQDRKKVEKLLQELTHPKAVGILSIFPENRKQPLEYAVKISETISIPKSRYEVTILKYMPHYSVDTKTKEVVNQSQKPLNPAIKVAINDGKKTYERWLWAKFPATPHKEEIEFPLRMRFTDFDLQDAAGKYILAVASGTQPWLLMSKKGRKRAEKAAIGRPYPFADKEYSFNIEKIIDGAIVKTDWTNGSERLLNPAVITTIKENGTSNQAVLELNKPLHHRTKSGTLVMLYRRTKAS